MRFHIVDVFAESRYAGNQLAVVRDAASLTDLQMQQIAREMNFSETSFVLSETPRDGGYDVRIFTPGAEVPFAGHPTLGTAWVIRHEVLRASAEEIALNLKVGRIPVRFDDDEPGPDVLWMRQRAPEFGPPTDGDAMARLLRLEPGDIDSRFPCQEVSTGLPFWLVPVRGLAAVRRARLNPDAYDELIAAGKTTAIFFFCTEAREPENQIHARMFAPHFGVPEDPATGSANGCLAGYLVQHRVLGDDRVDVRVEQGWEIGRPSLLRLRARPDAGQIRIEVGGRVFACARGELD